MKKSFTLLELLIAVFIVLVLSALGIGQYYKARSNVFAKDARGQLQMILQAEAVYKIDNAGNLLYCNSTLPCNGALGLMTLNMQQGRKYCANVANANSICVTAWTPDGANYSMNSNVGVVYAGNCPVTCIW